MSWHLHCSTCTLADAVVHMALEEHRSQGRGVVMLYQPEAKLVGNRGFSCDTQLSDLEYADDMTWWLPHGRLEGHAAITG